MPATRNLTMYQGDAYDHVVTVTDDANPAQPVDLSAGTFRAQIRRKISSTDVLASFTIDTTDAADGILVCSLSKAETATLPASCVYDLEDTTLGFTYLKGSITVEREVSRT